uniref:NADH-ubiquinone oxidoreductase chain 1 n=1 Tax=Iphiteon panicea TaxID=436082 RepID=A6YHJ8_9METZ|nr:NADH dehydrogenase subunit 1 [Iphiteon panicea]
MIIKTIQATLTLLPILIAIAFLTLLERKILSTTQTRKGPNIIGIFGTLQPIADAIKLIIKENSKPYKTNTYIFLISPTISISIAITAWSVIPLNYTTPQSDTNISIIIILALSSLSIYAILLTGWASNSKYSLLGSIRATAQMISYEISIGLIIITTIYISSNLNLSIITESQTHIWLSIPLFPALLMLLISSLAETNRTPFDLTESESELVSGFNVEYSAILFTLLFLAEYTNILLLSTIITILFLGGSTIAKTSNPTILATKIISISYLFIWIRATYPRIRYDQLMHLTWKNFLPLSLALTIITPSIILHSTP